MKNTFYEWLAYRLPERLVYFVAIRLMAHGTSGEYGKTNVTAVRAITLLRRWEKDNG